MAPSPLTFMLVKSGPFFFIAEKTANGNVYSWGVGTEGQLGQGDDVLFLSEPTRIRHDALNGAVVQISCGESYSAALTELGELYMWGKNSHIIHPDLAATHRIYSPRRVHTGGACVRRVVCGAWHAAALTGRPDWQRDSKASDLSDLSDSEDLESVAEGGSTSIAWSCDTISSPPQNVTSKAAMEKGLEREQTKISLAEFYAATPEPSPKARKPDEAVPTGHLRQTEPMEAFVEETQEQVTSEDNDGRFVYDDDEYEEDEDDNELNDLYEDDYEEDDDDMSMSITTTNHDTKCNSEVIISHDEMGKMRKEVDSTMQELCKTESSMSTESLPLSKETGYDSPMQEPSKKERRISTKSPSRSTKPTTSAMTQSSISAVDSRIVSQSTKPSTDFQDRPVLEDLEMHPEDMSMLVDEGINSETSTTSLGSSPVGSNSKNNVSLTPSIGHGSSNLHKGAKIPIMPSKPHSQSENSQFLPRSRTFISGSTNRSTRYMSRPQTQEHHADKAHKVMVTNFGFIDLPTSSQRVVHPPPRPKTQARSRQARTRDEASRHSGGRPMVPVPPSKRPSTSSDIQSVASLWSSREMPSSKPVMSPKIQIPSRRKPSILRNIASSASPQGQDAASHRVEFKKSNVSPSEKQTSSPKRDPVERKPYLRSHPFQPTSVQERRGSEGMRSRHNQDVSFPAGGLPLSKVTGLTRYPLEGPGASRSSDGVSPNPLVSDVMGPSWEQPVFSSGTAWRAMSRAKDPILSGSKTDPKPPQRGKRGEVGPS
ncbi:HERC2 [Branchiostoma lanceolatum]|uniref:HERC2 protein n=2 Tax=Branchiostoma lanceolatum TaxID=7740 RepID=A0A8S4MNK4_BRALA|nr:HERC2 [Branchiostoma lanceolatum]